MQKNKQSKKTIIQNDFQLLTPTSITMLFFIFWTYIIIKNYNTYISFNLDPLFIFFNNNHSSPTNIISTLANHIVRIILLISVYLSAFGFGKTIINFLNPPLKNNEKNIFSIVIGFGIFATFMILIGFTGLLYKSLLFPFLSIGLVLGIKNLLEKTKSEKTKSEPLSTVEIFGIILLLITFIYLFFSTLAPETFYDSLLTHIGAPNQWIIQHKISPIPFHFSTNMPSNIESLYTLTLMLSDDILARLLHLSFLILTASIIYIFCKNYFSRSCAIFAALIFSSSPIIAVVSVKTAVELGITLFEFSSLILFLLYTKNNDNPKLLLLSGIFCGLALGSKYTSIISLINMLVIITIYSIIKKISIKKLFINYILFLVPALIICSPWYLRNLIIVGNPLTPFFSRLGIPYTMKPYQWADPSIIHWTFKKIITSPWHITIKGLQPESYPGIIFLYLLPILFLVKKIPTVIKILFIYSFIYFLFDIFGARAYVRYFIPGLPAIIVLLTIYLTSINTKFLKIFLLSFVLIFSLWNITSGIILIITSLNPFNVAVGLQTKEDYLNTQRPSYPSAYYKAIEWMNNHSDKNDTFLFIGESRSFYSKRKTFYHTISDYSPIVSFTEKSKNADELFNILRREKIKYILISIPELSRLKSYDLLTWDKNSLTTFSKFWNKHIKLVYKDCADVTLNNKVRASQTPSFWNEYTKNPYNYIYVYEIIDETNEPENNFLLSRDFYSDERIKILKA